MCYISLSLSMYIYIYMYAYVCIYVYVYIYIYISDLTFETTTRHRLKGYVDQRVPSISLASSSRKYCN